MRDLIKLCEGLPPDEAVPVAIEPLLEHCRALEALSQVIRQNDPDAARLVQRRMTGRLTESSYREQSEDFASGVRGLLHEAAKGEASVRAELRKLGDLVHNPSPVRDFEGRINAYAASAATKFPRLASMIQSTVEWSIRNPNQQVFALSLIASAAAMAGTHMGGAMCFFLLKSANALVKQARAAKLAPMPTPMPTPTAARAKGPLNPNLLNAPALQHPRMAPRLPGDGPRPASTDSALPSTPAALSGVPAEPTPKRYPKNQALWARSKRMMGDPAAAERYYTNHGGKWVDATSIRSSKTKNGPPLDPMLWARSKRMAASMFPVYPSPEALQWARGYYGSHGGKFARPPAAPPIELDDHPAFSIGKAA